MIGVYETLGVPDAANASVRPKTISMAATSAATHQNVRAEVPRQPLSGDWKSRSRCRASQTVIFIQISASASYLW